MCIVTITELIALNSFGTQGGEHRVEIDGSRQTYNILLRMKVNCLSCRMTCLKWSQD